MYIFILFKLFYLLIFIFFFYFEFLPMIFDENEKINI